MILKELAGFIDGQVGLTIGTDLFIGELRPDLDLDCVVMVSAPARTPDNYTPLEYLTIDFYARYKNTDTGYNKLRAIFDLLHRKAHYNLDNYGIFLSECIGNIDDLDRDFNQRKILKLSVQFSYRRLAAVS